MVARQGAFLNHRHAWFDPARTTHNAGDARLTEEPAQPPSFCPHSGHSLSKIPAIKAVPLQSTISYLLSGFLTPLLHLPLIGRTRAIPRGSGSST
jgi:hypothetical protein